MCIHGPLNDAAHELPLQPLKAKLAATSELAAEAAGGLKQRGKQASTSTIIPSQGSSTYTWEQVAQHSKPDDAWIVVKDRVRDRGGCEARGTGRSHYAWLASWQHCLTRSPPPKLQVYDVTAFAKSHPGGRVIYEFAGRDATDVFSAFHSPAAWGMLRQHAVGRLQVGRAEGSICPTGRLPQH